MQKLEYSREHGSFYLMRVHKDGRREIVLMSEEIAILFDTGEGMLLKHGTPSAVQEQHSKLLNSGFQDGIVCLTSAAWDVDTLNRILSTSGYVGLWWKEQQARLSADIQQPGAPSAGVH